MSFRGLTIKGAILEGQSFLQPDEVGTLIGWWKWKTGITLNSGNVSQWDDASGNGYHLVQGNASRQPAYDSGSGRITPDGTADYLSFPITRNDSRPEFTFVIDMNGVGSSSTVFSYDTNTTVDADAIKLITYNGYMFKEQLTTANRYMIGTISSTKYVASFSWRGLFVNGVEVLYTTKSTQNWNGPTQNNMYLWAQARNSGGVPTTPINFGHAPILEMCYHSAPLSDGERHKMVTYFKQKHGIV